MERLTVRKGDIVYYVKDNDMIAPVNMSGFDVKQALTRLAELEDALENGRLVEAIRDGKE